MNVRAVVLCFSGLDPSGGAGLQADIEAIGQAGGHASIACTAITVQNSQQVFSFQSCESDLLKAQAMAILKDLPVKAIKSGMLASMDNIQLLTDLFLQKIISSTIPYVLDPILVANSGGHLGDKQTLIQGFHQLLPFATLITPNSLEIRDLTGIDNLLKACVDLCQRGAKAVLLKTAHEHQDDIQHYLYQTIDQNIVRTYHSVTPRLAGEYHGSGCSLASYIAAKLAQGDDLLNAVKQADSWLQKILYHADIPHPDGQRLPNRFVA